MKFKAFRIHETESGDIERRIESQSLSDLPEGEVVVKVKYAALNYKDALSASGNKGITRKYPHTPGIDVSGVVETSTVEQFTVGQEVIVTSYDLGMNTAGGFAEYIRVPAAWVVPKPATLDLYESMILGTAGFTAGLALWKMEQCGQTPSMGDIVVTGATGGVGSLAVAILAKAGYGVIATTGKTTETAYLTGLGAKRIETRAFADDASGRPLLKSLWAGAIDTVGGNTLATCLKGCARNGSVAATGLVASQKLDTTVYPFILNGINLLGIESAECPMAWRLQIWEAIATKWKPDNLASIAKLISLEELEAQIELMLRGQTRGRVIVGF